MRFRYDPPKSEKLKKTRGRSFDEVKEIFFSLHYEDQRNGRRLNYMNSSSNNKKKKPRSADEIGEMAERGEDVSRFFTGKGRMVPGVRRQEDIQRVNVDFTGEILNGLDLEARRLNISRQAVIKTLVSDGLDRRAKLRGKKATKQAS